MSPARTGVRVIAGSAKGRRLETPPGLETRPVTDRVKESLFGHLEPHLPGAKVLDLFAGSGALAIEALSRGAASATLVERDHRAASLIEANLERSGFAGQASVVIGDAATHLARGEPEPADLVFVDPPYALPTGDVEALLEELAARWLAPGATIVVRRDRRSGEPALPAGLRFTRVKRYGDTVVLVAAAR